MKSFFPNIYRFFLRHRTATTLVIYFFIVFIRYLYFGIDYYLQLDDYGQYSGTSSFIEGWQYILRAGLLKSRPMAGLCDVFIWRHFFGCMIVAVAIISFIFAASAVLFESVLNRLFGCSSLFSVIYLLIPINFEGSYWISASSRIVTSLFFVSLTGWLLLAYSERGKWYNAVFFFLSGILSTAFYEQGLVLSFTYVLMIMLYLMPKIQEKNYRPLLALGSIPYCAFYFIFTLLQPASQYYGARLVFNDIKSFDDLRYIAETVGGAILDILFRGSFMTYAKGFWRGIKIIISDSNFVWIAAALLSVAALCLTSHIAESNNCEPKYKTAIKKIVFALIMFSAPLSIFFAVGGTPWVSCRNIVPALPGIALFVDAVAEPIIRKKRVIVTVLCILFSFGAVIAAVSETSDYRQTFFNDQKVINSIISETYEDTMWIVNVKPSYLEDINYNENEHIIGITNSSWALSGGCSLYAKRSLNIYPLDIDNRIYYQNWNKETNRIPKDGTVYYYDFQADTLRKLQITDVSGKDNRQTEVFELYFEDSGILCGTVYQCENQGEFVPAN